MIFLVFTAALHRSVAEENDSKTVTNLLNNMTRFATSDTTSVPFASSEILTSSSFSDVKTLLDSIALASSDKISFTPSLEIKTGFPSYQYTVHYSDAISSSASSLDMTTVFPLSQITIHYSDEITPSVSFDMTAVSHPSHITVYYSDTITPTVSLNMTTFFTPSQIKVNYSDTITPTVSLRMENASSPSQTTVNYSDTITPTSSLNKTFSTSYKMTSSFFLTVINSSPSESIMESRFTTNNPSNQTESPTCYLECYINISFTTNKNSSQLANDINEVLSYEFKIAAYNGYLYLIFLKISAQTNNSVTYWFDLLFQRPYCDSILKQEVLTKSQQLSEKSFNGYTILPNSLQIKPFDIPASRNKLLSLEMKLEGDFNNELKNKNSEVYKILEYKMIRNLTFLMKSFRGFVKVIVNGFEEGSIVVKAQLLFDIDEIKVTDEEIKKDIEIKLIRYLGLLNDTICGYKVDIESFKIDGDVVVLQKSSSFPSWLIVLIVALCVVVPLIIIFIKQKV